MNIVITGSTGFLGSALAAHAASVGLRPILTPTLTKSERKTFTPLDEIDAADLIFHPAAMSSPERCEQDPSLAESSNLDLTRQVVGLARRTGAYLLFYSTDLVFNGAVPHAKMFSEEDQPSPCSVYAHTKYAAEQEVLSFERGTVVRVSLLFGPAYGDRRGVLGWTLDGLRGQGEVKLFHDEWRTPTFVDDACKISFKLAELGLPGLYHLTNGERVSRLEFGKLIAHVFALPSTRIVPVSRLEVPTTIERPRDVSLESRKIQEVTGMRPLSLQEALSVTRAREEAAIPPD